jgi:hypothetical protein
MLRAMVILAVALATASSVWAQTIDRSRQPVPIQRKPVERTEAKDQNQAQAPERPAIKAQPVVADNPKSM